MSNGEVYTGKGFGYVGPVTGELVFNTAMTGYQEILTDPSYTGQIVCMTAAHIGIVGVNPLDEESNQTKISAFVVRQLSRTTSNWRATADLASYCLEHKVAGIAEVDTRTITQNLRDAGLVNACVMQGDDIKLAVKLAKECKSMIGNPLANDAGTSKVYKSVEGNWQFNNKYKSYPKNSGAKVAIFDCGTKHAIARELTERGLQVSVIPSTTSVNEIKQNYHGLLISNGPGDPEPLTEIVAKVTKLVKDKFPIFGICLGHQILALACGAKSQQMKFGHHGANHPVLDLKSKQVAITSQNHGFMVVDKNLPTTLETTHISLFDKSIQGFKHKKAPIISFQGHPEASPGPIEMTSLFDQFTQLVTKHAKTKRY